MPHLSDIQLFIRVSEAGGISVAARQLGLTPATASAALKRLERELGSQLFERSTRSLRLTQAGEDFLRYCVQSTQALEEGMAALRQGRDCVSGEIHLGAPSDLGRDYLDEVLEPFRQQHPQVRIVMHLSDGLHDLYRNPIDLVLRYGLLRDSTLIARKLCDNDRVICAAPGYLERRGRPASVEALAAHNCICFYRNGELYNDWRLFHDGRTREVRVSGDRAADDGALVRKWALLGHGIAYKSRIDIHTDLAAGRLIDLFPDAQYEQVPLFAVYPSRQYQTARLQALLAYLQKVFSQPAPGQTTG
ncbi:LysR family transcriptional regulator [Niveibacterium umoris]|uniref:DNA-binding transcriptional LysR family regulator n=1 Tax=Niveibacterium umoris TaxID=1193620 RepID=A0A840BPM4_9RHOO|nr:LysR family transcriptional regulator [Niveibacterium umoris]MBB4013478.1 DNA-binding transcriptional LysR family regulator [Niveibacterium umoris]